MVGEINEEPVPIEDFFLVYPHKDLAELQVGTTKIDFYNGEVIKPDDTTDTITVALRDTTYDVCKSLFIYTEHTIHIKTPQKGHLDTSVFPEVFILYNVEFDVVEVEATRLTNFYIAGHTDPWGVPRLTIAPYKENVPFIERSAVATAGTPVTIDVRGSLGRDATTGYVANMGNTGGDLHIWEYDGINWTSDYYTIGPDGVVNYSNVSIQKLKIDATVNNTEYEVHLR